MIGYIVEISHSSYIGFLVQENSDSKVKIFLNTSPKPLDEITEEFQSFENVQITKEIPEPIQEIAKKIALIKQGFDQDLSYVSLDLTGYSEKQVQVIKTAMTIPVNEIWPYSKVAEIAGLPRAQRFVGTTMRVLRQPYIVPVQRVKSLSYIRKKERSDKRNYKRMPI